MNREEWKFVKQVRIEVYEQHGGKHLTWSFPIRCPRWLFNLLSNCSYE